MESTLDLRGFVRSRQMGLIYLYIDKLIVLQSTAIMPSTKLVRLTPDLQRALALHQERDGRSAEDIIRRAIRHYISEVDPLAMAGYCQSCGRRIPKRKGATYCETCAPGD
jgi:hypothetical protein